MINVEPQVIVAFICGFVSGMLVLLALFIFWPIDDSKHEDGSFYEEDYERPDVSDVFEQRYER